MIKRILVGLGDLDHATSATRHAIELARRKGASHTGVALVDVERLSETGSVPIGAGDYARQLAESRVSQARSLVDQLGREFTARCREVGLEYEMVPLEGDPFENLKNLSRYHDIVVTGQKALFEHGVVDDPSYGLIKLIEGGVRPIFAVTATYRPIDRILVAYSGSMESAKTMRRFVQLNPWPEARVRVATFTGAHNEPTELLRDAAGYFQQHAIDVETSHVPESPVDGLLGFAHQWQADLIVMGNSARNLLLRRIFGETMLHTLQTTDMPLFLSQ